MTLYEINKEIESLVDVETGEITDVEAFSNLALARDEKIENIALFIKNLRAEAEALAHEKDILADRERVAKNKAQRLTEYLNTMLEGQKFRSSKVAIGYRKSTKTQVDDKYLFDFIEWAEKNHPELLSRPTPKPNLILVKDYLSRGVEIPYAQTIENNNIQIR